MRSWRHAQLVGFLASHCKACSSDSISILEEVAMSSSSEMPDKLSSLVAVDFSSADSEGFSVVVSYAIVQE